MRAPIQSKKHIVQTSLASVTGGAKLDTELVSAIEANATTPSEVETGSVIKAIYIELWARAGETTAGSGQLVLYKTSGGAGAPSTANMAALHDWVNKKNILYTTMGLFNDQDTVAMPLLKSWIKIPKGKQRFGLGDKLRWTFFTPTIDIHLCGMAIYKEYS